MTENQIECRVESKIDRLDSRFMSGQLTQAEYNREYARIHAWADMEYKLAAMESAQ